MTRTVRTVQGIQGTDARSTARCGVDTTCPSSGSGQRTIVIELSYPQGTLTFLRLVILQSHPFLVKPRHAESRATEKRTSAGHVARDSCHWMRSAIPSTAAPVGNWEAGNQCSTMKRLPTGVQRSARSSSY